MNQNLTEIVFLLDRSGSMSSVWNDVENGLKELLKQQQKAPGDCKFTLIAFDSYEPYNVVVDAVDVRSVELDFQRVFPRGGTPLIQSMDVAIDETGRRFRDMPEKDRPGKVVFVVFTDGEENSSSRQYSKEALAANVKHQTDKYNWQFIFMGADIDAFGEASGMGIAGGMTLGVAKAAHSGSSIGYTGQKIASYRTVGCSSLLSYTEAERAMFDKDDSNPVPPKTP